MKNKIPLIALLFIVFSTISRILVGNSVELGNDEVYYWLYGLYPDISHFDHPPMVGFFIQLVTFNLYFDSELGIRLAAIIPASVNMFIVYKIGVYLKNELAGLINILLYNISIYGLVISGIFVLPDSPLLMFWLLSFFFFLKTLPLAPDKANKKQLLLAFIFAGLAVYSKYQGVFLLLGAGAYILFFNRAWLKTKVIYLFLIFPIAAFLLILYWNYQNDFISFSYHNNRVSLFSLNFNKDSFFRELAGQILYNNPFVIILLFLAIRAFFKKSLAMERNIFYFFLAFAFPLILTVVYLSLYRDTLPHWSGVAYTTLLPLAGIYISDRRKYIRATWIAGVSVFVLLIFAVNLVNKGWFLPKDTAQDIQLGKDDFTLDMYGWRQAKDKIALFFEENNSLKQLPIVSNKWFPAAHIHYYIVKPMNKTIIVQGKLEAIHKYYWINKQQAPIASDAIYITDSRNYLAPDHIYHSPFRAHKLLKKIPITRNDKVVKYIFIYRLTGLPSS